MREVWRIEDQHVNEARKAMDESISFGLVDTTLAGYLEIALVRNPQIKSARQEWKAALERIPQARSLPDPELGYGYFLQEVETRVGAQKQRLSFTQGFPWFGTLGIRGDLAASTAHVAHERYSAALLGTARDVAAAYAEYYYLAAALQVTRENTELLVGWERVLRSRYAAGRASFSDLNRVQVELGKLEDRIITLERQREPSMARLRRLLDLPERTILPWPGNLPRFQALPPRAELVERIEENPELRALTAAAEKEARSIDLARKSYFPTFMVGVDWIQTDRRDMPDLADNGKDPVIARVGVRIPLWLGKYAAEVREAHARGEAARARLDAETNRVENDLSTHLFRYDDAVRKVALYGDSLIPKGEQSLRAAYAAYEAGEGDFLGVLDAERILLEFSLMLERARADEVIAQATVMTLIGRGPGTE